MAKNQPPDDIKLNDQIGQLEQNAAEFEAKWKRALADYQNLEKRVEKQQQQFVRLANLSLIDRLLPVIDDLNRAAQHLNDDGLNLVLKQLSELLKSEGVEVIESQDKPFNPELMECVDTVPGPKNTVTAVHLEGYTLNGIVLRPAKVEVGSGEKTADKKLTKKSS